MSKITKGNLLYGQSGGPTSTINTSAYGLFVEAFKHKEIEKVYATNYGVKGIISNDFVEIKNDKKLAKLKNTPGAIFGSNRFKLEDYHVNDTTYKLILETFKKNNIRYFFYNGGNDSMDTIRKISKYLSRNHYECYCIGIIKTIDNDLFGTDFSLGYAAAATFIINSTIEITLDDLSYEVGRVNIIETMGRNCGWLAASAKLAKLKNLEPDLIYVPELPLNIDKFLADVKNVYEKKKHCTVIVSEGLKDETGHFLSERSSTNDCFGHNQLGGLSISLAHLVTEKLGYKTRYHELSLLQRANSLSVSKVEQKVAMKLSSFALKSALKGETNKVVVITRKNSYPYKFSLSLVPIKEVANLEKFLDKKYLPEINGSINDSFIDYLSPLVDTILDVYIKD